MDINKHQKQAIIKLQKQKVGALFMEPGTGKTLAASILIKSVPDVDYILWLTPFQTKNNLKFEVEKCGGLSNLDIIGIESLSNSDNLYLRLLTKLKNSNNPFIVVDESLKIKNEDAKRTQRIIELGKLSEFKLILNGTPLSRNLLDLWSQMEFLSSKILKMNFSQFKNSFVEYTTITKKFGYRSFSKEFINKYHNVDYLFALIKPFVYEAKLELNKKKQYIDVSYELSEEELEEHNFIKEKYLDNDAMEMRNNNIFLEITQKLQYNYSCSPEKFQIVKKLLKENSKEKFIIFAKYIETQQELKEHFPNCKVLSWQKHAFGLNLQEYNRIIFFDKTWDYALRDQAEHRVYRLGQTEDCIFYDLTGNVGLESLINQNIDKKQRLLDYFKNKSVKELMEKL